MAATLSSMIPLGTIAPKFILTNTAKNNIINLETLKPQKGLLIMFICNHCPYVIHIIDELTELCNKFIDKGIDVIAINSNNYRAYPDDSPENMKKLAIEKGFNFPYLIDETQEVAKSYIATCTPDFFLFDSDFKLVYRGQFDSSRPGNGVPVTGKDLKNALEAHISGSQINHEQIPSIGCNIKWK